MPRILHTADWHLGARLAQRSREEEQRAFLNWLAEEVRAEAVDVVLVAGDVFERAEPPPSAQRLFFDGVTSLAEAGAEVVVLAGDYDGVPALEAPRALLRGLGVHVVARSVERIALRSGLEVVAVPPAALADVAPREILREACAGVGVGAVALAHLHLADAPDAAPRALPGGRAEDAWFPEVVAYAAIGHDHSRTQSGRLACPGSPVPLRFAEAGPRAVLLLDDPARAPAVIEVPRWRALWRLEGTREEVEAQLLAAAGEGPPPLVSVHVRVARPDPTLLPHLASVAERAGVELVEVRQEAPRAPSLPVPRLLELDPEAVFRLLLKRRNERLDPDVLAAFSRIVDEVQ